MDREAEIAGSLSGDFRGEGFGPVSGGFLAKVALGKIVITDGANHEIARSPSLRLRASGASSFDLFHVTIGNRFHWER